MNGSRYRPRTSPTGHNTPDEADQEMPRRNSNSCFAGRPRPLSSYFWAALLPSCVSGLSLVPKPPPSNFPTAQPISGFERNDYTGDANRGLPVSSHSFSSHATGLCPSYPRKSNSWLATRRRSFAPWLWFLVRYRVRPQSSKLLQKWSEERVFSGQIACCRPAINRGQDDHATRPLQPQKGRFSILAALIFLDIGRGPAGVPAVYRSHWFLVPGSINVNCSAVLPALFI